MRSPIVNYSLFRVTRRIFVRSHSLLVPIKCIIGSVKKKKKTLMSCEIFREVFREKKCIPFNYFRRRYQPGKVHPESKQNHTVQQQNNFYLSIVECIYFDATSDDAL